MDDRHHHRRRLILVGFVAFLFAVASLVLSGLSLQGSANDGNGGGGGGGGGGGSPAPSTGACPLGYQLLPPQPAPSSCTLSTRAALVPDACDATVRDVCVTHEIAGDGLYCVHANRWNMSSVLLNGAVHSADQCDSAAPLVAPPTVNVTVTKLADSGAGLRGDLSLSLRNTGDCPARLAGVLVLLEQLNNLPASYPGSYGAHGSAMRLWGAAGVENAALTAACPADSMAPTCFGASCGANVSYTPAHLVLRPSQNVPDLDALTVPAASVIHVNMTVDFELSTSEWQLLRLPGTTLLRLHVLVTYDTCCDRTPAQTCGIDLDCDGQLDGARTVEAASADLEVPASCTELCDCVSFGDTVDGTWFAPTSNCSAQPASPAPLASVASVCVSATYASITVGTTPCCDAGISEYGCNGANYSLMHQPCIAPAAGQTCIGDFAAYPGSDSLILAFCAPVPDVTMDCACTPYALDVYDLGADCLHVIPRSDGCGHTLNYSRACSPAYANTVCQSNNSCTCTPYNLTAHYDNVSKPCFHWQLVDTGCGNLQNYSRACSPSYANTVCQLNNSCTCTNYPLSVYDNGTLACFPTQLHDNGCGGLTNYSRACANASLACQANGTCTCVPFTLAHYDNVSKPCFHAQNLSNGCTGNQTYSRACSPSYANTACQLNDTCTCTPYNMSHYDTNSSDACFPSQILDNGCGGTGHYFRPCNNSFDTCNPDHTCTACVPRNESFYDNGTSACFHPQTLNNGCGGTANYSRACSPSYNNTVCNANNTCTCTPYDLSHFDNGTTDCYHIQGHDNGCGGISPYFRLCVNETYTCQNNGTCTPPCVPYNLSHYDNSTTDCFYPQTLDNGCGNTAEYSRDCADAWPNTVCNPNNTCTCTPYPLSHYDPGPNVTDCFASRDLDNGCGGTPAYLRPCANGSFACQGPVEENPLLDVCVCSAFEATPCVNDTYTCTENICPTCNAYVNASCPVWPGYNSTFCNPTQCANTVTGCGHRVSEGVGLLHCCDPLADPYDCQDGYTCNGGTFQCE